MNFCDRQIFCFFDCVVPRKLFLQNHFNQINRDEIIVLFNQSILVYYYIVYSGSIKGALNVKLKSQQPSKLMITINPLKATLEAA